MNTPAPALAVLTLLLAAPAAARVEVRLRGDCRRPLPGNKTWTPCAAAHAVNLLYEAGFLSISRSYDEKLRAEPAPSTAALACLDDNGVEYLHEREDLLRDIDRIRAWAEAAADIEADVEDPGCVDFVGGYMIGGVKSDHPERMASNIAVSAWALTHHHGEALKRRGKADLDALEKAAAEREKKEYVAQREFLLGQLDDLRAWAEKATTPETPVAVKDPPLERYDAEEIAKTEKMLLEMQETLKKTDEKLKRIRKMLDEAPKARKAILRPSALPSALKPPKAEPKE